MTTAQLAAAKVRVVYIPLGAAALSAVAGFAVVHSRLAIVLLLGMSAATILLIQPLATLGALAVALTTAAYRGFFFAVRVDIAGIPISIFDVLWICVLAKVLPAWLGPARGRNRLPAALLMCAAIMTVLVGLIWQQPMYNIVRFFRAELFLVVGFMLGQSLRADDQIRALRALIIGGTITAVMQIVTFAFALGGSNIWARLGISAFGRVAEFEVDPQATSAFRDNGVTINFAMLAAIVLVASIVVRRELFPAPQPSVLLAVCGIGLLVSLTRTVWLGFVLGCLAVFVVVPRPRLGPLVKKSVGGLLTAGLLVALLVAIGGRSGSFIEETIVNRFATFSSGAEDYSLRQRVDESKVALAEVGSNWWSGVGATDVVVMKEYRGAVQKNSIHNGYLHYLITGGVLGLGSLLYLALSSLNAGWGRARRGAGEDDTLIGTATFAVLGTMLFVAVLGGVLNDAFQSPIVGVFAGLAYGHGIRPTIDKGLLEA